MGFGSTKIEISTPQRSMEQINRNQLKGMLAGIAVALLCLHLVSMALQQRGTNLSNDALPTLAAVDKALGNDALPAVSAASADEGSVQAACTVTVRVQMLN